ATAAPSSSGFLVLDLDSQPGPDRVYVADDGAAPNGGIQCWQLVSGVWQLERTASVGAAGARGLTGYVTSNSVVLFATTGESSANRLVTVTDDGSAFSFPTIIATAPTNTVFRGVDFTPRPLQTSNSTGVPATS